MAHATGVRRYVQPYEIDLAVQSEMRKLPEKIPKLNHHRGQRCRVCQNPDSRALVNKMLAHLMTCADIHQVIDLMVNPNRAKNAKISYRSVWYHARNHFNIDDPAGAYYRELMEKQATAHQTEEGINGINRLLNAFGYLDVMAHRGYETLIKEDTYISPTTGMEAILKLHALTQRAAGHHTEVELRQQLAVIQNAVKEIVPQEYWNAIIERIEDGETKAISSVMEAEVVDDYDDYGDDEPFSPLVEADTDDTLEG